MPVICPVKRLRRLFWCSKAIRLIGRSSVYTCRSERMNSFIARSVSSNWCWPLSAVRGCVPAGVRLGCSSRRPARSGDFRTAVAVDSVDGCWSTGFCLSNPSRWSVRSAWGQATGLINRLHSVVSGGGQRWTRPARDGHFIQVDNPLKWILWRRWKRDIQLNIMQTEPIFRCNDNISCTGADKSLYQGWSNSPQNLNKLTVFDVLFGPCIYTVLNWKIFYYYFLFFQQRTEKKF